MSHPCQHCPLPTSERIKEGARILVPVMPDQNLLAAELKSSAMPGQGNHPAPRPRVPLVLSLHPLPGRREQKSKPEETVTIEIHR